MSRLLYVDILNYSNRFFPEGYAWDLKRASDGVNEFVAAARKSGITLKVFIDAETSTEEADEKWRRRREDEVALLKRVMPQGLQTLLGDMFREAGVEVHYSVEFDNDDTLAFFAQADGADVLSQDSDFFRYIGSSFRLYAGFSIERGGLELTPHWGSRKPWVDQRHIEPKPATQSSCPILIGVVRKKHYLRGAPSPLVRLLGNPHIAIRPLRLAAYHHLGITGPIREEFPVWGAGRTEWDIKEVMPDGAYSQLLGDPAAAVKRFFPELARERPPNVKSVDWSKHHFAAYAVINEMCCAANKTSYLRMMMLSLEPLHLDTAEHDGSITGKGGKGAGKGKGKGKGY